MTLKEWLDFADKYIMTKQEMKEFLGMSDYGINQSLSAKRIKPVFSRGKGRSMVRLYYLPDVQEYKKSVELQHKRLKIKK